MNGRKSVGWIAQLYALFKARSRESQEDIERLAETFEREEAEALEADSTERQVPTRHFESAPATRSSRS